MEDADSNLIEFGKKCKCSVILLMGMRTRKDGTTIKTCALIPASSKPSFETNEFIEQLIQKVKSDVRELTDVRPHKKEWRFFLQYTSTGRQLFTSYIQAI